MLMLNGRNQAMQSLKIFLGIVFLMGTFMLIGCAGCLAGDSEGPSDSPRPFSSQVLLKKCERIEEINQRNQRANNEPYKYKF